MDVIFLAVYTADNKKNIEHLGLELLLTVMEIHNISSEIKVVFTNQAFGSDEDIIALIPESTHLLCITLDFNTLEYVDNLTQRIKSTYPFLHITSGGNFVSQFKKDILLSCKAIDSIMIGESEATIVSLWNSLLWNCISECKGLIYRDSDGSIIENAKRNLLEMNEIPVAKRTMLKPSQPSQYARIQSSRGCRGCCAFCTEHSMYGFYGSDKRWRGRTPSAVIEEIREIKRKFGISNFTFVDSSFEDSEENTKDRLISFCHMLIEEKLNIFFVALMRAENFTKPDDGNCLSLLREAGLVEAFLGIESFSEKTLKLFNKRATLKDNLNAIKMFQNYQINFNIGLIMFHPYTTLDEISMNVEYLHKYKQMHRYTILSNSLYLYKNTPLYIKVEEDRLLSNYSISNPLGYQCQDSAVNNIRNAIEYTNEKLRETMSLIHQVEGNLLYLARLIAKVRKLYPDSDISKSLCDTESNIIDLLSEKYTKLFRFILDNADLITGKSYAKFFSSLLTPTFLEDLLICLRSTIKSFGKKATKFGLDISIL